MLFNSLSLLAKSTGLNGYAPEEAAAAASDAVSAVTTAASDAQAMGSGGSIWLMVAYIVGLVVLFYFFAIKPQKKREKELHAMQDSIKVGDWVMTSSGFYGKVADITDQVFVVEFGTNKSVMIPVNKSEILGNKEPNLTNKPKEDNSESK